jgi:hypothetical protein
MSESIALPVSGLQSFSSVEARPERLSSDAGAVVLRDSLEKAPEMKRAARRNRSHACRPSTAHTASIRPTPNANVRRPHSDPQSSARK